MKKLMPAWLKDLLTAPTATLSRWQYAVRYFLELCRHGARQLREDRANQMAAALAFRTLFGLIPVIIIVMLVFRAFGGADQFADLVSELLTAAKLHDVAGPDESATLAAWAAQIIHDLDANISGRTIGIIGLLVFSWAAIGLLSTIERSFNTICRAPQHRGLARRIPLYWTSITIGPALLYLSFQFRGRFVDWIESAGWGAPIAAAIGLATSFFSVWLFLICLYTLMPHTRVRLPTAAAGAAVATLLWMAATHVFGWYLTSSFSKESSAFMILYGTLGLIPLFLFWVYFLWLVVLYGLELSVLLQVVGGRMEKGRPLRGDRPALLDPASVVPLVRVIAERFETGEPTCAEDIAVALRLHSETVEALLTAVADAGVLHRVERAGKTAYTLARPPGAIHTGELLKIAQRLACDFAMERSPATAWVERFREAQLKLALHRPIAEL